MSSSGDSAESSGPEYSFPGLNVPVKLPIGSYIDGIIRTYDEGNQLFYVRFFDYSTRDLNEALDNWAQDGSSHAIYSDSTHDKLALYKTQQTLSRVHIRQTTADTFTVFDIDSGTIHHKSHRNHLFKIPEDSILRSIPPQVVPIFYKKYSKGDFLMSHACLNEAMVHVQLQEDRRNYSATYFRVFLHDGSEVDITDALEETREFKKNTLNPDAELTCCFPEKGCPTRAITRGALPLEAPPLTTTPSTTSAPDQTGMDHDLLTAIIVGSCIIGIIIFVLAAFYLYKRFGNHLSERHRRHHHGHRRHRNESQQNSDQGSPPSSQKREPLPIPADGPPPPLANNNDNVLARLPQYNIMECPHSGSYTQVNRNINPMLQENSASPNRAMTPLKTAEMSTQTHTANSLTKSAEPAHDDDASSNRAQPSGSRMSAGSSSSEFSEATLQPSLKSSLHSNEPSLVPSMASSGFVVGQPSPAFRPQPLSLPLKTSLRTTAISSPAKTTFRTTTMSSPGPAPSDYLTTSRGPTMAEVDDDSDEEDEDSVTRSVDDCERVLAAYKAPGPSPASGSAHRTKSHLSTRPLPSSSLTHYSHTEDCDTAAHNHAYRPHLISLPERTAPRREEKRREEKTPVRPVDLSIHSFPTLSPRSVSTQSSLHTAARRESTVSWLADATQSSMGRSMQDDEFSL